MPKTLFSYQKQAIEDLRERWKEEEARRLAIVIPTGGGKTVVFSRLTKETLQEHPDKRVLILVHTDELVQQTVEKIRDEDPSLQVGIVKGKQNDVTADVIVASVMTLKNDRRLAQVRHLALIIVDECDLAAAPSYMKILTHFGCFRPDGVRAVGFTATLTRTDGKIGLVWQDVAFSVDISWMIRRKFLIPPRGIAVQVPDLDLRKVKATKADFREGELGEALAESLAPELVAKAIKEHASDRKVLAFFPTVASAYVFAEAINAEGIFAEVVHGGMPTEERKAVLSRHKRGTVLVNCMILTVGYDDPEVDCIVIGRPTKSKRLYIQIVGRGLRVDRSRDYEGQDCLLLDVVGANINHSLRTLVDLSDKPINPEKAKSGRTLTELEDEFDAGEGVEEDEPVFYQGPVEVKEFDPLGRTDNKKVWLKTREGTYFLPGGKDAYVFLMEYPEPGKWAVFWCAKTASQTFFMCDGEPHSECVCLGGCQRRNVALFPYGPGTLEETMSAAEDLATDLGTSTINLANKKAPWRKRPASQGMVDMAKNLGISASTSDTAGKVSDQITKIMGSRRIDPLVRKVKK